MSFGWFDDLVQQLTGEAVGQAAAGVAKTSPVVGFLLSTLWESGGGLDDGPGGDVDPMSGAPSANPFTVEPGPDNPYETGPDNPYDTGTDNPFDPDPGDPSTPKEDLRLADNDFAGVSFGWGDNGPSVQLVTPSYGAENPPVGQSDELDGNLAASPVNQAPLDLTGASPIAVDVPPPTPTPPSDADPADEFGAYWRGLPLAALPLAAQFTPARLPPMLPGTTFYGGRVQFPLPPPLPRLPAQLAFVGWIPPSYNNPIPYLTTVTDTGSTALNYVVGGLYSWDNVARLASNIVLVDLQGALGVLADVNTWLDEHGMNPNATPGDVEPAIVGSAQYLSAGAGSWLGSFRLDLAVAQDTKASGAAGATAWGAPVKTLFPRSTGPDIPFPSIWREPYSIAQGTPAGFSSPAEFQQFSSWMYRQFGASQIAGNVYFQGSSVTGYGYGTAYLPGYGYVANAPFDFMRISDYDLAVVSPELVQKAEQLGIDLRGQDTRTEPLSQANLSSLGLDQIANSLSAAAGRPVNIMLYLNDSAVQRTPSILAPR